MSIKYLYELKLRGCDKVFRDDLGPGVVVSQEVHFDTNDRTSVMLAASLLEVRNKFIEDNIEVEISELKEI